jgi:hypothetical protein
MRILQTACAAAVTLVLMLASAAPAAAQAAEYSDTHAGLTLEGRFINADGACNGYPMYLPGGSVDILLVVGNDHIQRPQPFTLNVEMTRWPSGESLGYFFPDPPTVPAGEQVEVPVTLSVPTDAEGLYALSVSLYAASDRGRPSGSSRVPPFVNVNMIFCTPSA